MVSNPLFFQIEFMNAYKRNPLKHSSRCRSCQVFMHCKPVHASLLPSQETRTFAFSSTVTSYFQGDGHDVISRIKVLPPGESHVAIVRRISSRVRQFLIHSTRWGIITGPPSAKWQNFAYCRPIFIIFGTYTL